MAYTVPPGYAGTYGCYSMQPLYSIADPYTSRYHKNVALKIGTSEGENQSFKTFQDNQDELCRPIADSADARRVPGGRPERCISLSCIASRHLRQGIQESVSRTGFTCLSIELTDIQERIYFYG